jgi:L-threonylcarbamoyladenylate synthase
MLLRPGGILRTQIEAVLGETLAQPPEDTELSEPHPLAPGMLASHYAPRTPVRLNATDLMSGEALLAFGVPIAGAMSAVAAMNLSNHGDLVEAAANLFGHLRALDSKKASAIAVMPIPNDGLGEAINDRLRRAAAPHR